MVVGDHLVAPDVGRGRTLDAHASIIGIISHQIAGLAAQAAIAAAEPFGRIAHAHLDCAAVTGAVDRTRHRPSLAGQKPLSRPRFSAHRGPVVAPLRIVLAGRCPISVVLPVVIDGFGAEAPLPIFSAF